MSSSNLKWVYGSSHRAQDVSNETVDAYKSIIQQLYLDQNRTREEVLRQLKKVHGFSLSTNQFSKATKRWGFYKQPRQGPTRIQPPESITEEDQVPKPLNALKELFDYEPDLLDTIEETEACCQADSENVTVSQSLEDFHGELLYTEMNFVSERNPSTNHWLPKAVSVDTPCHALPCDTDKCLPESSKTQLQQLKTARKLETGPHSISSKMTQVLSDIQINKSRVDFLVCCYLFQEAVYCSERPDRSLDKREHRVPRSNTNKLFSQYRRDTDKLLASPSIALDMWSILCLLEQDGMLDDLVDRLDINDRRFMTAVRACFELCKKWMDLVGNLPRGSLQFDSLLLHQNAGKAIQNICRPLHKQDRYDIWQEAGYLFAFIWSNEKLEAIESWSWLKEAEISGLSPTHFLAIICHMIVHTTALSSPDFGTISGKTNGCGKPICELYLQTMEKIKRTNPTRTVKKEFITYFFNQHAGLDMDPAENRNLESVQSYQRTAESFVFKQERDNLIEKVQQASYSLSYSYVHQHYLTSLTSNPTMARSLASGSSRGSSLNSFRGFQAASRAMARGLKKDQG